MSLKEGLPKWIFRVSSKWVRLGLDELRIASPKVRPHLFWRTSKVYFFELSCTLSKKSKNDQSYPFILGHWFLLSFQPPRLKDSTLKPNLTFEILSQRLLPNTTKFVLITDKFVRPTVASRAIPNISRIIHFQRIPISFHRSTKAISLDTRPAAYDDETIPDSPSRISTLQSDTIVAGEWLWYLSFRMRIIAWFSWRQDSWLHSRKYRIVFVRCGSLVFEGLLWVLCIECLFLCMLLSLAVFGRE